MLKKVPLNLFDAPNRATKIVGVLVPSPAFLRAAICVESNKAASCLTVRLFSSAVQTPGPLLAGLALCLPIGKQAANEQLLVIEVEFGTISLLAQNEHQAI